MHITVTLTVAESKRLIAKALVQTDTVQTALHGGIVAVAPGTTNGYVVEELTGQPIDKRCFVTGHTLPSHYTGPRCEKSVPDLVLHKGQRLDASATDAVNEMGPGDVFIKGANAVNHDLDQAALLIGHPTGGTLGAVLGTIVARRIHLIHPVGLEKSVPGDLNNAAFVQKDMDGKGPALWVSPGEVFTEIEAFAVLCDVQAVPLASGGVGGAEGAVWLMLIGDPETLANAEQTIAAIQGEPPFLPTRG